MQAPALPGHRPLQRALRVLWARPRLLVSVVLGLAVARWVPFAWSASPLTRSLLGWNAGVLLYLALAAHVMTASSHDRMRQRASHEDEGRWLVLTLASLSVLASLVAIGLQLGVARQLPETGRLWHIGLAGLTVLTSWTFMQVMFALHYAHEFYAPRQGQAAGGMAFPGTHTPDYLDFLYAACSIGTSGQTSDVALTASPMRRTALLHCVLAFFFNTTVLALAINMAAGLL